MAASFNDIRQAWRALLHRPGFLVLAAATLALGIGASVAVLSLVDRVLLRPLPYPTPERLFAAGTVQAGGWTSITPQEYRAIEGIDGVDLGLISMLPMPVNLADEGDPELVQAYWADAALLDVLSLPMRLGRGFVAEEDLPDGAPAAVLSHGLWQRRFGGDPDVIGRILRVEGRATPIVGVLPARTRLTAPFELLLPAAIPAHTRDNGRNYLALARIGAGTAPEAVADQVHRRLLDLYGVTEVPRFLGTSRFGLQPLSALLGLQARPILLLFLASALCVLVLAAVNLANLMLLRALARSHVAAVRGALGASRLRLALPMLAEGMLVAAVGAVAGLVLAVAGLRLVAGRIPPQWFGGETDLSLGPLAYAFALLAALAVAVLAAGLGVWRGRTRDGARDLVAGGRSGIGAGAGRLTRSLVIAQVALAALLLSGAGLFTRALQDASRVELGYRTQGLLGFEIAPVRAQYPRAEDMKTLAGQVVERLQAVPGVRAAAAGTNLPIGEPLNYPVQVPGGEAFSVEFRGITPGFLASFDIPLLAGRDVDVRDAEGGAGVVLVNAAFARRHLDLVDGGPGAYAQALDRTLAMPVGDALLPLRIVGVVGDTRQHGPQAAAPPMVYLPLAQIPGSLLSMLRDYAPLRFAVRVEGAPLAYGESVRAAVAEIAPGQAIANLQPVTALVRASTDGTRLNLLLVGLFAALAVLLSAVGLYAVIAVATANRRREFGVRAALGSRSGALLRLVLADGLRQVAIGLGLGLLASWAMARLLRSYVAGVGDTDAAVVAAVVVVLAGAALLACLVPAWRAARVSPMQALRE